MILADTKEYVGVYYGMNQWLPCNPHPHPHPHPHPTLPLFFKAFFLPWAIHRILYLSKFNRNSPSSTVNQ
ncbi:hypothetical protein L1987_10195 [Smallanthus sonchifolius]|uniref:Uncharacterized protein n=1 Tax=Smallanthus sonchifolius TaxID=185202 RepID=A0ACB9JRF3_9ASTR|nr:hypothetical protein L1987_10195 [Smallanthus sonchifolius]